MILTLATSAIAAGCAPRSPSAATGGAAGSAAHGSGETIVYNQYWLEARWSRFDAWPYGLSPRNGAAVSASGSAREPESAPSFDDPLSVLHHVLAHAPENPVVYPTECYYYYRFPLGARTVSGNLRFTDIERGVLHIGYFDAHDIGTTRHASVGPDQGLRVQRLGGGAWRVTWGDVVRTFTLTDHAVAIHPDLRLDEHEEIVCGVIDESGFSLTMLWDDRVSGFLYVMPTGQPWPDGRAVEAVGDWRLHIGQESRFVFLEEPDLGRLVLVGVSARSVADNDYFDGPFDQVPPNLPLRDRLTRAYPYVQSRGGIDEHGVFRELEGQRVAISPYTTYWRLDEMFDAVRTLQGREVAIARARHVLTFEPKRLAPGAPTSAGVATLGEALSGSAASGGVRPPLPDPRSVD